MAHPGGRPTLYTPELGARVCHLISTIPLGIKRICNANPDIPSHETIASWKVQHPEFFGQYLAAKDNQATEIVESLWEEMEQGVTTNEEIAMLNLKFRFHQWQLSKLAPKQFGDKKQIQQDMNINVHEQDLQSLK
jgi:hypothetical protein